MDVKVRHLAATPVGRTVRTIARVLEIDGKSVVFEIEAWDGDRKIGDGTHRRGIVNVVEFEKRFGVKQLSMSVARAYPNVAVPDIALIGTSSH